MKTTRPTFVGDAIHMDGNGVQIGAYGDFKLYSAYQPIWRLGEKSQLTVCGYEGLIRPRIGNKAINPAEMFEEVDIEDALFVECMCHALHLRNYHHSLPGECPLFFNINPENYPSIEAFEYNFRFLTGKLPALGIPRRNIVLEVVETDQRADGVLGRIRDFAREEGIRLAIDDFGQSCSTLDRYLAFMPEIVKVDRDVFHNACEDHDARRALSETINQFHGHRTTVLIEGIETDAQFDVARSLEADMFQGFLLGRPTVLPANFSH